MAELIIEILGWFGIILILTGYFLLTSKKLNEKSKTYHLMNLIGGSSIAINAISNNAYPPTILNIVWGIVAIYGIIKGITK
jgi:formate hydrogenlyase subunit 3/multisubunit Na+/H+ antiporter MnhD subunit